jgi:hypothetical protein
LVEQLAFNQFVEGSNPSRPTTSKIIDFKFISQIVNNKKSRLLAD